MQLKAHHVNQGAIRSCLHFLSSVMKTNKKPVSDKGESTGNEMNSAIKVCSSVGLQCHCPPTWMCLSAALYFDLVTYFFCSVSAGIQYHSIRIIFIVVVLWCHTYTHRDLPRCACAKLVTFVILCAWMLELLGSFVCMSLVAGEGWLQIRAPAVSLHNYHKSNWHLSDHLLLILVLPG